MVEMRHVCGAVICKSVRVPMSSDLVTISCVALHPLSIIDNGNQLERMDPKDGKF